MSASTTAPSTESSVQARYAAAAQTQEAALCCPVDYDPKFLKIIPAEVIEKDYGCGDPSRNLQPGETVLDLGSGTGKICFIAAQVVGPQGKVIGIDMTDAMLEVARRNAPIVAERLGYSNVEFRKGRIQDLALNLDLLSTKLKESPVQDAEGWLRSAALADQLRAESPLITSQSIDVVVSNCVLNLVDSPSKSILFAEIFRVLRPGGRAVISDIVSDEIVPLHLQKDPTLWSGCISGALTEEGFLKAFTDAGFYGIRILKRDAQPWRVVEDIEFRSVTIEAFKAPHSPCTSQHQAVIYNGPFKSVVDDEGNSFERGHQQMTCERTFQKLDRAPYAGLFTLLEGKSEPCQENKSKASALPALPKAKKPVKGAFYKSISGNGGGCCDSPKEGCC